MFIESFLSHPNKNFQTESKILMLGSFADFKNLYIYMFVLHDIEIPV